MKEQDIFLIIAIIVVVVFVPFGCWLIFYMENQQKVIEDKKNEEARELGVLAEQNRIDAGGNPFHPDDYDRRRMWLRGWVESRMKKN